MGNQPPEQPKPDRVPEGGDRRSDELTRKRDAAKKKETDESFMKRYDLMRDLKLDPEDHDTYRKTFNRVQEQKMKRERSERTKSFRSMERIKGRGVDISKPYTARESMNIFSRRGAIRGVLEEGAHVRILKPYTRILPLSADLLSNLGIEASASGELDDWVYIETVSKPRNKFQKEYTYRGWVSMSVLEKDPLSDLENVSPVKPEKSAKPESAKPEKPDSAKRPDAPKPPEAPKTPEKTPPKAPEKPLPKPPEKEDPITPEMVALVQDKYRVTGVTSQERQSSLSEMVYDLMVASRVPSPKIALMHAKVTPTVLAYIDSAAVSSGMIDNGKEYRLTSENKKVLIKIVRDILKAEKPKWM